MCTLIICLIISIKSGNENFLKIMILYKPKINMFSYSFTSKKYNFLETFTWLLGWCPIKTPTMFDRTNERVQLICINYSLSILNHIIFHFLNTEKSSASNISNIFSNTELLNTVVYQYELGGSVSQNY